MIVQPVPMIVHVQPVPMMVKPDFLNLVVDFLFTGSIVDCPPYIDSKIFNQDNFVYLCICQYEFRYFA